MSVKQVDQFIKNAGLIVWDKAKAYVKPNLKHTTGREQTDPDYGSMLTISYSKYWRGWS